MSKYAARDNWFTGGWPGGEVGLKEGFIQEPFEKPSQAQKQYDEFPDDAKGEDDIYVGKGKYVKGNAKKFAGRDNPFHRRLGRRRGRPQERGAAQAQGWRLRSDQEEERRLLRLPRNHHRRAGEDGHREEGRG